MVNTQWFAVILGTVCGALVAWIGLRARAAALKSRLAFYENELTISKTQLTNHQEASAKLRETVARLESTLSHEKSASQEKLALVDRATEELREAFQALAAE